MFLFSENDIFRKKQRIGFLSVFFGILGKCSGLSPILGFGREQGAFK